MQIHRKIGNELTNRGKTAMKYVSYHILTVSSISAQLFVFWLSTKGSLFPGEETIQSIVSTGAQIIAGLYGITLAGYTFFLSRIDALSASDMTLDYVIASVKSRFKYLIWWITGNVLVTLFVSIALMYMPAPEQGNYLFFYRLFCNEFVLALASSIVLILYYSILVIDPNCLEKEAAKLKRKLSRGIPVQGGAAEFIALYDKIETLCNGMVPQAVLNQIHENKGKRFEYTISLLQETRQLDPMALYDLNRIHRYYECMINCSSLGATREMCELARNMAAYLEQKPEKELKKK